MAVHAETSTFNLTLFDAHVNLLLSAAVVGYEPGVLRTRPESHFDKVIDPAAGSYYIENLTVAIAKQAWELFLAVEEAGGFYAALKAGTVQAAVNESNKVWYGVILETGKNKLGLPGDGTAEILNVKCDPVLAASCRTQPGFFPAWHMNKEKWLSILLNEPELDAAIKNLLALSFDLTSSPHHSK